MGQILGYYEGSVEEFVADGLDQSTPSGDITFILGNGDEGDGFCTQNKVFKCGGSGEPTLPAYAEYTGTATAVVVTTKYGYFPDTLVEGARVAVKFEGSLTYITSLNVNDTGAKNVYYKGNSLTSGMINRYNTYDFIYDGTYWRIIGVNTDTDTHYTAKNIVGASTTAKANAAATNGNVHLNLVENSTVRSTHNIKGENGVEVTSDASGNITISGSGENYTESPFYITEFTLEDLRASSSEQTYYPCDAAAVCAALDTGKVILVPVMAGGTGYVVAKTYYEDLLYWTIYDADFLEVFTFETAVSATDIESVSVQTRELVDTSNVKTINGQSLLGSGDIPISGGSYVPMPETFVEQGGALDYTLLPNSSLYAYLIGSGRVSIYLQEPTSFGVVNEYTMIFRTLGFGNAITFDKTIIWANDNAPVLDDSVAEILEISVKCINASMYEGIQYLGTWAKFSVS